MAERRTWATAREQMLMAQAWDEGWDWRDDCDPNGCVFSQQDAGQGDEINPYRSGVGDRPAEEFPSALASEGGQKLPGNSEGDRTTERPPCFDSYECETRGCYGESVGVVGCYGARFLHNGEGDRG